MNKNYLSDILHQLSLCSPPSSIDFIRQVYSIKWGDIGGDDIEICSDIVLRISADCICVNISESSYFDYKKLLILISKDIFKSGICDKSKEFEIYFCRFVEYVNEMA
jgi:hypothetical protein